MTTEEALKQLEPFSGRIPTDALNTIRETWPEAEPVLLEELDWRIKYPYADDRSARFVYALFLLAELKSAAAFERYVTLASFPEFILDRIFGDMVTESLRHFLANTCCGQTEKLQAFIENRAVFEYARSAGLFALEQITLNGGFPLKKMEMYCIELLSRRLEQKPSYMFDTVITVCDHLKFKTALSFIKTAYDRNLADPYVQSYKAIEASLNQADDLPPEKRRYDVLEPTEREIRFYTDYWGDHGGPAGEKDHSGLLNAPANERRQQNRKNMAGNEPGRNEPCPCGSGKKYKKCCIATGFVQSDLPDEDRVEMPATRTDEWIMAGYYYMKHRDDWKALCCWKTAWPLVLEKIPPTVTSPTDPRTDDLFNGYDFFSNWIQDLQAVIDNMANDSVAALQFGFEYLPRLLERFPEMDTVLRCNFEESFARMEHACGKTEQAIDRLERMINHFPKRAQGYAVLADLFSFDAHGKPDLPRAQQLLTQALLNAEDCADWDIQARLDDLPHC